MIRVRVIACGRDFAKSSCMLKIRRETQKKTNFVVVRTAKV